MGGGRGGGGGEGYFFEGFLFQFVPGWVLVSGRGLE